MIKLYSYFRSSAAYRIRIALNIKGIDYQLMPINLLEHQQRSDEYLKINAQGLVPALGLEDGRVITQSTAILEWLEESYPEPILLSTDQYQRANIRAAVNSIACDIHPLNNLRILKYLTGTLAINEEQKNDWYKHWINTGFESLEKRLSTTATYSMSNDVSMVDIYLIPQVYNALRFNIDINKFTNIKRAYENCCQLEAFHNAAPEQQPDNPEMHNSENT